MIQQRVEPPLAVITLSGHFLYVSHHYEGILVHLLQRFAAVFGIIVLLMTQFQPSFSCQTDGLTFDSKILWYTEEFTVDSMTARCLGPVAAE